MYSIGDCRLSDMKYFGYLFRHSRATRLYEELPQQIVEKLMGHKNMAGVYAHISSKKAREEMLNKIYKVQELTPQDKEELLKMKEEIETLNKKIDLQNKMYAVSLQKIMPTIRKKILEDLNEGNIIFDKKSNKFIFNQKYDF